MFQNFPQSDLDIVAPDGTLRARTKGIVHREKITLPDTSIVILVGDEIRRTLPNGTEETFTVIDPTYHQAFHTIPAHFDVKIQRKGNFPKGTGGHYTIHVSGANSRVNLHSIDNSNNTLHASGDVFSNASDALRRAVSDHQELAHLTQLLDEMKNSSEDKGHYLSVYQKFVTAAANHMTVLAPFIPALTSLLS